MDTKITKKRLNDHLSYDWIKYVAIIAAVIFLFWFLYDVGAAKPSNAQRLEIYMLNCSPVSDETGSFQQKLKDRVNGPAVYDDRGLEVWLEDETLEVTVNDYAGYSTDSNIAQAVSVKLQGGRESDLMVMDDGTFGGFVQNWLISVTAYLEEVRVKLKEMLPVVKDYPTEVSDNSDLGALTKMKERRLWESIEEEYKKLLPRIAEDQYGFYHERVKEESLEKWREISDTFDKNTQTIRSKNPEDLTSEDIEKYNAELAAFNAAYAELEKEDRVCWGLDLSKFNRDKVKNKWFTADERYQRKFGETSPTGLYFKMGISNFGQFNGTTYYELVKVLNFVIDEFAV